jgi:hypothetical protein
LDFLFPDQDLVPAVVQWLGKDEVKLVLEGGDSILVLRRIGSEQISPFKAEEQASSPTGAGGPSRKHPTRKKPTTSTGQAPGATQPPQPQD